MDKEILKNNKFFTKIPIVKANSNNIDFALDDLKECLKSRGVELDREDLLKFLDIFTRVLFDEIRLKPYNDKNLISDINIMINTIVINSINDIDRIKDVVSTVHNLSQNKIKDDSFNIILNNVQIIIEEFSTFFNELIHLLENIYESIDTDKNISNYTIAIKSNTDNLSYTLTYATPPKGLSFMVIFIYSNIISGNVEQDTTHIIMKTFPKNEELDKYIKDHT